MTNEQAGAAMPAALAEILSEPGWTQACLGHCWIREWLDDVSDLVASLQVSDGVFSGAMGLMVPSFYQTRQTPEEVYAVADLMRRIEQALAGDAAPGAGEGVG